MWIYYFSCSDKIEMNRLRKSIVTIVISIDFSNILWWSNHIARSSIMRQWNLHLSVHFMIDLKENPFIISPSKLLFRVYLAGCCSVLYRRDDLVKFPNILFIISKFKFQKQTVQRIYNLRSLFKQPIFEELIQSAYLKRIIFKEHYWFDKFIRKYEFYMNLFIF